MAESSGAGVCTALNIPDKTPCRDPATSVNGFFCTFHSRQVQALYRGYKKRSAELEELDANPPKCGIPKNLGGTDFKSLDDEEDLKELHTYLLRRWHLLHRCVEARDWHHTHFFSDNSDFGHQKYVDRLRSARLMVGEALGRIERRMIEACNKKESWIAWVAQIQAEQDAKSEARKKRIKAAAALEKSHEASVKKSLAAKEALRQQELEAAEWDPIELIVEDRRIELVTLLKVMLDSEGAGEQDSSKAKETAEQLGTSAKTVLPSKHADSEEVFGPKWRSRMDPEFRKDYQEAEKLRKQLNDMSMKEAVKSNGGSLEQSEMMVCHLGKDGRMRTGKVPVGPNGEIDHTKIKYDDQDAEKVEIFDTSDVKDPEMKTILDSINQLTEMHTPFDSNEKKEEFKRKCHEEMKGIREFLLLRLIIASPPLLSAALEHESLDSFFADKDRVRGADLRDLALNLSTPSLQAVRDACEDFWAEKNPPSSNGSKQPQTMWLPPKKVTKITKSKSGEETKKVVEEPERKIVKNAPPEKIKICGRYIHNYPKQTTLSRKGWYHFALITGTTVTEAARTCSGWGEYYNLLMLVQTGYFRGLPVDWGGPHEPYLTQTWRSMNFVAFWQDSSAEADTFETMKPSGRGKSRMFHAKDVRNHIVANMSRTDPAVRRFIAMLPTYTSQVVCYIRDMQTGKVIYEPPAEEQELWLKREILAPRRPEDPNWNVTLAYDKKYRALIAENRPWRYDFTDYLEVSIWWRYPAHKMDLLQKFITRLLFKAYKIESPLDLVQITLNTFHRCAKDDEDEKGEYLGKIKQIRRDIKAYRRSHPPDPNMSVRSMHYTPLERYIDKVHAPFDHSPYWREADERAIPDELHTLFSKAEAIEDPKEKEKFMIDAVIPVLVKTPLGNEGKKSALEEFENESDDEAAATPVGPTQEASPAPPDHDGTDSALGSEDSESDRDDHLSEDSGIEDDGAESEGVVDNESYVWEDAKDQALMVWDFCEDEAKKCHEMQEAIAPGSRDKFLGGREKALRAVHNVGNVSSRKKEKMEGMLDAAIKSSAKLPGGVGKYLPPNLFFCMNAVGLLWKEGGDAEFMKKANEWSDEWRDGEPFEPILLWDKEARARNPPPRRSIRPPKAVWDTFDDAVKGSAKRRGKQLREIQVEEIDLPEGWEKYILTRICELERAKVIRTSWECQTMMCVAGRESPESDLQLYVDYRPLLRPEADVYIQKPEGITIPPPTYLLDEMEMWQKKHPNAKYSLLKMHSGQEFWDFDWDDDEDTEALCFRDPLDRAWEWIKMPKDMPYSEYFMQEKMEQWTIQPLSRRNDPMALITYWIRIRIDTVLVMGRDEKEAESWTLQAMAFLRKRPAGFDIDLARSFMNVDAGFLRKLPPGWWEKASSAAHPMYT